MKKKKRKTFVQKLCAQLVEQFKRKNRGDCEEGGFFAILFLVYFLLLHSVALKFTVERVE